MIQVNVYERGEYLGSATYAGPNETMLSAVTKTKKAFKEIGRLIPGETTLEVKYTDVPEMDFGNIIKIE